MLRTPTPDTFDGAFNFCRVMFQSSRDGDGGNWSVDYPRADINLSVRLGELTKTRVSFQNDGEPKHVVVTLRDAELFQCPFVMMTEVGSSYFAEDEVERLREYLQKGGFLWADDFWGSYAWEHWAREIGKVLPPHEYPIIDLPKDHPLFRSQFEIKKVPQIPSINHWMGSGGGTSERGCRQCRFRPRAASTTVLAGCSCSSRTTPTSATPGSVRPTTRTTSTIFPSTATPSGSTVLSSTP